MSFILNSFNDWIKNFLIGCITQILTGMFDSVNSSVGSIASEVGQTPQGWNANIFSMVQNLSQTVIIPIAGIILTFVVCYELISMIMEKNNMHEMDTWMFFKWIFKTFIAIYLVTHTFDITVAVFGLAQHVVQGSAGIISGSTNIDISSVTNNLQAQLNGMDVPSLFVLWMESLLISLSIQILSICIFLIIYGRMLEIYLLCSIGPIPFATMTNREWGDIGKNYLKSLFALGFQGFLIMVCVAIYAVLVQTISTTGDLQAAIWSCAGYTVLLCFALFKTGSLSKSIFNAH
jgi:hypothetical protein